MCMLWLISFALALSICEDLKAREIYIMKNCCLQWDLNPRPARSSYWKADVSPDGQRIRSVISTWAIYYITQTRSRLRRLVLSRIVV